MSDFWCAVLGGVGGGRDERGMGKGHVVGLGGLVKDKNGSNWTHLLTLAKDGPCAERDGQGSGAVRQARASRVSTKSPGFFHPHFPSGPSWPGLLTVRDHQGQEA